MFVPGKVFVNTFDTLTDRQCTRKLPRGLSDPMANDGGGGDNHDHGQQVLDLRHLSISRKVVQGSTNRRALGCVNAAGKLRQKW